MKLNPTQSLFYSNYYIFLWNRTRLKQGVAHNQAYLRWNMTTLSSYKSLRFSCFPLVITSGCFFIINHPTCEKKNPLFALCGSASVSEYLWCMRWSLAHSKMSFCAAKQFIIMRYTFRGQVALYVRWVHSLWAPTVTPMPPHRNNSTLQNQVHGFAEGTR